MYDELKAKCETFKAEILAVLPELADGSRLKDYQSGVLHHAINRAANEINTIISTIDSYYSED